MPTLSHDSVTLHYETWGSGPAVLLLAPGGLRASRIETWANAPWNPIEALAGDHFVVGMDQRNTGTSFAPITAADGWPSYTRDQLAVMDHLGIERFSLLGMCIGGAFILRLLSEAPERIQAAVALQPIGQEGNRGEFRAIFDQWRADIAGDHPETTDADWEGCWSNLFGVEHLLWSVPDAQLPTLRTPLLVLEGNDVYHPSSASRHLAAAAPNASLIEQWKEPEAQPAARAAVAEFLTAHRD